MAPEAGATATSLGTAVEAAVARLRASGSDTARLDAELLVAHVLRVDRTTVIAHPEVPLSPDVARGLEEAVGRRERGEPVAYIRGVKEFHGLAFSVDSRALIPRPDTEVLVDLGVARVVDRILSAGRCRVVDVGTGSGAVAVAVAATLRTRGMLHAADLVATDVSADALVLATENAVAHGLADTIRFARADLLEADEAGVSAAGHTGDPGSAHSAPPLSAIDVLLANLPYVPSADVPRLPVAASFEPRRALDGGPDGLDLVRRLLAQLPAALTRGGVALLEIGAGEADAVRTAVERVLPGWSVEFHRDLAGIDRVAEVRAPGGRTGEMATGGGA